MKAVPVFLLVLVASFLGVCVLRAQPRCTICHSKSPQVRAMHKAVEDRDCFSCHVRGEPLRRNGGIAKEKHKAFLTQRRSDARCTSCHEGESIHRARPASKGHPTLLSGRTYCPTCRIIGDKDWKMCPKCRGPLLDLDRLMRRSALNPDDALCRTCHPVDASLVAVHRQKADEDLSAQSVCLGCHEGHKACSGCHESQ
ncbi:MAG: hypothetical protein JRI36_05995 [Deltaproteobacteria bacterium]|nr:hypothetical protein [Deltaproteobacteria bacterium]